MKPSNPQSRDHRVAGSLAAAVLFGSLAVSNGFADSGSAWGPEWTSNGELVLPSGYHSWVFLGAPLTPQALNDGQAGFPEFHNVYIHPEAYQGYRKTGRFPEGTILLKELQLTLPGTQDDGSRVEASGRGYFPGVRNGIDISVKDSERFKETNGWGFFNFGHHAPPYAKTAAAAPKEACAACHIANGDDMVFTKFYSQILDAE
ncbi:MAG: cytochrome P460 family protein [Pseudomonadota bacterium]